jgi:membrane fusion protein, multidrug efflux system
MESCLTCPSPVLPPPGVSGLRSRVARTVAPAVAAMLIVVVAFLLAGCQDSNGQTGAAPPPPPVSVAPAIERTIQESDEFTGRLEATETVDLRPRVAGYINVVHFHEGQEVRKGDLMYTIDAAPYRAELAKAQAQLAAARTQAELARTEQVRAKTLLDLKAISQQEYDQLTSAQHSADANATAVEAAVASAQLNVEYTVIRAPIAGRVSRTNVTAGNLVSNGDPVLTTIVSLDRVYAYFDASEEAYLRYSDQVRASTRGGAGAKPSPVLMGLANEEGFPHQGQIDFVDNRLNPQTGAIRARAVFDNSDRRYTPGLFARIKLIGNGHEDAVLTPDRAIGTNQSMKFVLVVGDGNVAQLREVKLGPLVGSMRVIRSGLKPGDLVVVNGLQRVRPGTPVTPDKLEVNAEGMPIDKPAQQHAAGEQKAQS